MEYPEVYRLSLQEAKARGEERRFIESHKKNMACREAIETAIGKSGREGCAGGMLEAYGAERVLWVLAASLRQRDYDRRFSYGILKWAEGFSIPESLDAGYDLRLDYMVQGKPEALEKFIETVQEAIHKAEGKEQPAAFGGRCCECCRSFSKCRIRKKGRRWLRWRLCLFRKTLRK